VYLDILETKQVKGFDTVEWLKKKIDEAQKKFGEKYKLENITIGVSAGVPSGVTGTLTITLEPK
jgi:hypothetical protein